MTATATAFTVFLFVFAFFGAARATVGTTDTFSSALFGFDYVEDRPADDERYHCDCNDFTRSHFITAFTLSKRIPL